VTFVLRRLATTATVLTAVAVGATGFCAGSQASTPTTGAVSSFAYISTSRQGSAVYVNGLVKQNSSSGLIRSANRRAYLQRNLNGSWQTMLSRVTDSQGLFTVGFISVPNYQYRYIVLASAGALGTTSGVAQTVSPAVRYSNCAALNAVYPYGVGKSGAHDITRSGTDPVLDFIVSSAVYNLNTGRDADHDGVACEKH
jgi:hypothetical protein